MRASLTRRLCPVNSSRHPSDQGAGQLEPGEGHRAKRARRGDHDPLRPRRALPMARVDTHMRGERPGQEHVGQGVQPRQRRVRGLLRKVEERVLLFQGLVGRRCRRVHGGARCVSGVLLRGPRQAIVGLDESERVPQKSWLRGVSGPGNHPHPLRLKNSTHRQWHETHDVQSKNA